MGHVLISPEQFPVTFMPTYVGWTHSTMCRDAKPQITQTVNWNAYHYATNALMRKLHHSCPNTMDTPNTNVQERKQLWHRKAPVCLNYPVIHCLRSFLTYPASYYCTRSLPALPTLLHTLEQLLVHLPLSLQVIMVRALNSLNHLFSLIRWDY